MKSLNINSSQILNYIVRFCKNIRSLIFCICKIKTFGVRALIFNEAGDFLLVHHTYCTGWYTPGGALNYNETPLEALKRELFEEIGYNYRL
ncbi:MAG: NUDIX domain-containing protein [Rickettsiaceae bacterium]|nr:MAG: NUDIX domain-containing protein [Rickettsiaceae bacterium]